MVVVSVVVVFVVAWKDTVHRFPIAKTMILLLLMSCKWGKKQNKKAQSNQYVAKCLLHQSLRDQTPDNVTKSTAHQAGFTGNNNVSKGSNALLKP